VKAVYKILGLVLTVVLAAGLAGCSSITVNYDYDTNVNWEKYKTYAWLGKESEDATPMDSNLLDQRIRSSVDWEMEQRQIAPGDNPDCYVVYHTGAQDKIQVTDWGYRYSDYYWGYGGRQVDVYQYTEGTLVIDVIDAETKNMVWRGIGQGVVDQTQRTPEQMQERIDGVVNKVMASFPPVK
jgi:uncharacterized protein YceK